MSWMPIETPETVRERVPPSTPASGLSSRRAKASHTAISMAALAMLCPADRGEGRNDLVRMGVVVSGRQRPQEIADQVFGGANRFVGIARSDIGDALGMPAHSIDLGFEEEELLFGHPREAGFEGVLEVEPEFPDRESIDLHAAAPNVKGR